VKALDLPGIKLALEARGITLEPPLPSESLKRFTAELDLSGSEDILSIYKIFDGFSSCDERSQMCFWSMGRVLEYTSIFYRVDGRIWYPIGDILIDSDFFMCSMEGSGSVFLLYEGRELAPNVFNFLESLAMGAFDFLASNDKVA
jgi:hypothetical protein